MSPLSHNRPAIKDRAVNLQSFAEKLKKLRKERGWSQDDLAEHSGIHGRHVGKYEIGRAIPNAETLVRIARALEVSLDYLMIDNELTPNPAAKLRDRELLHHFELADQMNEEERRTVKDLIDAYIKRSQFADIMGGKKAASS